MAETIPDHSYTTQDASTFPIQNEVSLNNLVPTAVPVAVASPSAIIWTPRFMILFASLFVSGLCVASITTQLWLNGLVRDETILLIFTALTLASSLLIVVKVQNGWLRTGGVFASIWGLLMGVHFAIPMVSLLDPHTSLMSHLDIATQSAFLGASICISIAYTTLRRWDNWFFCLLPVIGAAIVLLSMLLSPTDLPGGNFNESMIVTALLYLGVILWWFRPANWRAQPGVTFFLGAIPLLQIIFSGSGFHKNDVAFFITQVFLYFFFLINLRLLQGEQRLFKRSY
jgi:hypothetical protein